MQIWEVRLCKPFLFLYLLWIYVVCWLSEFYSANQHFRYRKLPVATPESYQKLFRYSVYLKIKILDPISIFLSLFSVK